MSNHRPRHRNALKTRHHRPGTAPGTYDTPHTRSSGASAVTVIEYDEHRVTRREGLDGMAAAAPDQVRWLRLKAHPPVAVLERLQHEHHVDPMALEGVVTHGHRPRFAEFPSGSLISVEIPDVDGGEFRTLFMYLSGNTLITFFDDDTLFAPIDQRLNSPTRLRGSSVHFLVYALLDLAIDLLFPLNDHIGERLDKLEAEILDHPGAPFLNETHTLRRELVMVRRTAWATRELVGDLMRHWDSEALHPLRMFLQDSYEHVVTIIDLVETQRDIATSLVEVYLSLTSNRLNDVMKVLTIIATLFIPPTFLVGLYGMNFDRRAGPWSMPELGWPYGYLMVLTAIGFMIVAMLIYFRRKRWI